MTKTAKNRRFTSLGVIRILERLTADDLQSVIDWIGNTAPGDLWLELLGRVNQLIGVWFRRDFRHAPGTIISQENINDLLRVDSLMHGLLVQISRIQENLAESRKEGLGGRADLGPRPFPPGKEDEAPSEDVPLEVLIDTLAARLRGIRETPGDFDDVNLSDEEISEIIQSLIDDLKARNPQR